LLTPNFESINTFFILYCGTYLYKLKVSLLISHLISRTSDFEHLNVELKNSHKMNEIVSKQSHNVTVTRIQTPFESSPLQA